MNDTSFRPTGRERRNVLVTGGAGYIGAHVAKALSEAGFNPVVYDNLSSGYREAVLWGPLVRGDIRDGERLRAAIRQHNIGAAIHLASLIEVGRSNTRPDLFYDINVGGTLGLLEALKDCGVKRLVFSSSAAVYGQPAGSSLLPLTEDAPKEPASPYGDTKLACERMIAAYCRAFGLSAVALRYFNAAGADSTGLIGEAHNPETHLIPLAIAAALGHGPPLSIFGADFDTPDGYCLRDYVHVTDLASAHLAALLAPMVEGAFDAFNIGTGEGRSVQQVIRAVSRIVERNLPSSVEARRAGDPPCQIADPKKAQTLLGWRATHSGLGRIVADAVGWALAPAYGAGVPANDPKPAPAGLAPFAEPSLEGAESISTAGLSAG